VRVQIVKDVETKMKTTLTSLRMITIVSTILLLAGTAGFCSQVNTEGKVSVLMIISGGVIFTALMGFLVGRLQNGKSN
jgi:arginine exporter protein ArgO